MLNREKRGVRQPWEGAVGGAGGGAPVILKSRGQADGPLGSPAKVTRDAD